MKKLIALTLVLGICYSCCAQKSKAKPIPVVPKDTILGPPAGTVVIVLNQDQVHMLEDVIAESTAPYKEVNILLGILRTQQYHPPVAPPDTAHAKPIIPKDTAVKKN